MFRVAQQLPHQADCTHDAAVAASRRAAMVYRNPICPALPYPHRSLRPGKTRNHAIAGEHVERRHVGFAVFLKCPLTDRGVHRKLTIFRCMRDLSSARAAGDVVRARAL